LTAQGKYVRLTDMVDATGHSAVTIKKWADEGRIKRIQTESGKRYLLPEKQIAFSAHGAKVLKEKKIMEKDGKLITVPEYMSKTGLARTTTYNAIKSGWLATELNDDGKRCIRWFNKTRNLILFKEGQDGHCDDEVQEIENNINESNREKSKGVKIGSLIPPKMWAELVGLAYQTVNKAINEGVFSECALEVTAIGGGSQRQHHVIEWPGYDTAMLITEILKRRMKPVEKKYQLNRICNSIDETPLVEPEVPEVPVVIEPEPEPEEPEPVEQPPQANIDDDRFEKLETRVRKVEEAFKKMILANAGF